MKHKKLVGIIGIVVHLLCVAACTHTNTKGDYKERAYKELETVLKERMNVLSNYLEMAKLNAGKVYSDSVMLSFFMAKKDYYSLSKEMILPEEFKNTITSLKRKVQRHYLKNYLMFYDILFIDKRGDIFYTIRKEKDYHNNIFEGSLAATRLSEKLLSGTNRSFVDFQFYDVSGEPSAFFIEPIVNNKKLEGWCVFQFAIGKIDEIFEYHDVLGKTGEIVLVNKAHYLLSNSRFEVHNTILKQKLPRNNIESKFKERKGRKEVVDYRGNEVISVFEVFDFFGTEWLIIAKIDKAELFTNDYMEHSDTDFDNVFPSLCRDYPELLRNDTLKSVVRVDMDEMKRSDTNNILFTQGVSTCTVIIAYYSGRFSYMAHISPYDKIYGDTQTDILGRMLKKISFYDVTESGKQNLKFYLISAYEQSFKSCINKIVADGYLLSQIEIAYKPDVEYLNVYHSFLNGEVFVNPVRKQ